MKIVVLSLQGVFFCCSYVFAVVVLLDMKKGRRKMNYFFCKNSKDTSTHFTYLRIHRRYFISFSYTASEDSSMEYRGRYEGTLLLNQSVSSTGDIVMVFVGEFVSRFGGNNESDLEEWKMMNEQRHRRRH